MSLRRKTPSSLDCGGEGKLAEPTSPLVGERREENKGEVEISSEEELSSKEELSSERELLSEE